MIELARRLVRAGVPVFVATPVMGSDGNWDATAGVGGYKLPTGWQRTPASETVLDAWRPGDALCAVGGVTFGTVDIDPQNGGGNSWERWTAQHGEPKVYVESKTPSGGRHLMVASLDVAEMDGMLQGVDFKDGRADGSSRGFVFLAPTEKASKIDGSLGAYVVVQDRGLAEVEAAWESWGRDAGLTIRDIVLQDRSGALLRDHLASKRAMVKREYGPRPDGPTPAWNPFSSTQETTREAEGEVGRALSLVRSATSGNVYPALNEAALKLGHYVGSLIEEGCGADDCAGLPEVTGGWGIVSAAGERMLRRALDENPAVVNWRKSGRPGAWDETRTIRKGMADGRTKGWISVVDPPERTTKIVVDRQVHVTPAPLDAQGAPLGEAVVTIEEIVTEVVEEEFDWSASLQAAVAKVADDLYVDVASHFAGGAEGPRPTVLKRTDGLPLFYPGAVNTVFGDPECGKTFIVLMAIAEQLKVTGRAVHMDIDHNGPAAILERLEMLGVDRDVLCDRTRFLLAEPADEQTLRAVIVDLDVNGFVAGAVDAGLDCVVGIDSVGELVPMFGGNSDKADDYSRVNRDVMATLAGMGACVIVVDHMAKAVDSRNYGASGTAAKKRAADGSYLRVEGMKQFARGRGGSAKVFITKDRHGALRQVCGGGREPLVAKVVLDVPGIMGTAWRIEAPDEKDVKAILDTIGPETNRRAKIVRILFDHVTLSGTKLQGIAKGSTNDHVRTRDDLVERGVLTKVLGHGRGGPEYQYSLTPLAACRDAETQGLRDALLAMTEPTPTTESNNLAVEANIERPTD